MQNILRTLVIITIVTLSISHALAEQKPQARHSVALASTYLREIYPDRYYYRGYDIQATYRYSFGRQKWCDFHFTASLQATSTRYSAIAFPTDDYRDGYELGITVGLLWEVFLYKDYFSVYAGGFIGPMYTPLMPARQGGDINFSDNLCAGLNVKLYKALSLDLRAGYRHMSNAGFSSPNYGLNNYWFGLGLIYRIRN